jgi:predicted metal-dependent hydrolase
MEIILLVILLLILVLFKPKYVIINNNIKVLNLPNKKQAAKSIIKVKRKLDSLLKTLNLKNSHRYKNKITESPPNNKHTSYTINKGENIYMCVREKDLSLSDHNTLMFVALHELAHVITDSIGHTPEFWNNFRFLLKAAIKKGYYRYVNYKKTPTAYCGTYITNNPLSN